MEWHNRTAAGSRVLYHIGPKPPQPKPFVPKMTIDNELLVDHERPWLKEGPDSAIFLTNNPVAVWENHGIRGHLYAYRVPEWVIEQSGGMHRYSDASEIVIPASLWKHVKFMGKTMDDTSLEKKVEKIMTQGREQIIYKDRIYGPRPWKNNTEQSIDKQAVQIALNEGIRRKANHWEDEDLRSEHEKLYGDLTQSMIQYENFMDFVLNLDDAPDLQSDDVHKAIVALNLAIIDWSYEFYKPKKTDPRSVTPPVRMKNVDPDTLKEIF